MTYAKAVVMGIVALATAIATAYEDGALTWGEALTGVLAVLGSAGVVWYAQNGPGAQYVKAVVATISAALTSLVVAVDDSVITTQEVWTAVAATAVALAAVYAVPNQGGATT